MQWKKHNNLQKNVFHPTTVECVWTSIRSIIKQKNIVRLENAGGTQNKWLKKYKTCTERRKRELSKQSIKNREIEYIWSSASRSCDISDVLLHHPWLGRLNSLFYSPRYSASEFHPVHFNHSFHSFTHFTGGHAANRQHHN